MRNSRGTTSLTIASIYKVQISLLPGKQRSNLIPSFGEPTDLLCTLIYSCPVWRVTTKLEKTPSLGISYLISGPSIEKEASAIYQPIKALPHVLPFRKGVVRPELTAWILEAL